MNKEYNNIKGKDVKFLLDSSYKRNKQILYEKRPERFNRFQLDKKLSNSEHKVFTDIQNNNKPVVVFTGTRKFGDYFTDVALALGAENFTPRFRNSQKLLDEVKNKYHSNAIIVGHSLGGDISRHVGSKEDKIISYNAGTGLGDLLFRPVRNNETLLRTNSDLVSGLSVINPLNALSSGKRLTIQNPNIFTSHNLSSLDNIKNKTII
jgi:hypothetical protein